MSLAEDPFSQALAAAEAGELERAEAAFRQLIGEKPDHLQGLRGLAGVLRRQAREIEAEAIEQDARRVESTDLAKIAAQLINMGRHQSARRPVDRALELDPGNPDALSLAGGLARIAGDFEQAAEFYARAHVLDPEEPHVAAALQVLTGQPPGAGLEEKMPVIVPFVRLGGFLDSEARDSVMAFAQSNLASFKQSRVVRDLELTYDGAVRSSRVSMEPKQIAAWFKPRILAVLPEVFLRLGIAPFEVGRIELQMTAHLDGDFYSLHNDNSHGARKGHDSDARRISFVYYFCCEPKRFTGGELRLYDTDLRRGTYSKAVFSRIAPDDNTIVFFPSAAAHEVGRLNMDSTNPADGRFTLNGWLHPIV